MASVPDRNELLRYKTTENYLLNCGKKTYDEIDKRRKIAIGKVSSGILVDEVVR